MERSFTHATVVGANGFIGSKVASSLASKGLTVNTPDKDDLSWIDRPQGLLVYAAGFTADYLNQPLKTLEAHSQLIGQVVENAMYQSLVYLSSVRLYDGQTGIVDESTSLSLDSANIRHYFDLTKALGEWFVRHQGGPNAHIIRLGVVYSDQLGSDCFLERMIRRAVMGQGGAIDTSWSHKRDYIHLSDVVKIIWAVAKLGKEDIYLAASGQMIDNKMLFTWLEQRTGTKLTALRDSKSISTPQIAIERLKMELGIKPMSLDVGLDRVLMWQDNIRSMVSVKEIQHMPWM